MSHAPDDSQDLELQGQVSYVPDRVLGLRASDRHDHPVAYLWRDAANPRICAVSVGQGARSSYVQENCPEFILVAPDVGNGLEKQTAFATTPLILPRGRYLGMARDRYLGVLSELDYERLRAAIERGRPRRVESR